MFENNHAVNEYDGTSDPLEGPLEGGGAVMLESSSNATFLGCNFTLNTGVVSTRASEGGIEKERRFCFRSVRQKSSANFRLLPCFDAVCACLPAFLSARLPAAAYQLPPMPSPFGR